MTVVTEKAFIENNLFRERLLDIPDEKTFELLPEALT